MTIFLIRHGKTEANEKWLYCGKTDLPLTPGGREELQHIEYSIPKNCRFISSGLRRANESLELLFGKVPYDVNPELQEMDFGSFEMRSHNELKDQAEYLTWISGDNDSNVTPGGESGKLMRKRALSAFLKIAEKEQDTVIVTHGGVIAAIMAHLFPMESKNRYQWQSANGRGYKLTCTNGVWTYEKTGIGISPDGAEI